MDSTEDLRAALAAFAAQQQNAPQTPARVTARPSAMLAEPQSPARDKALEDWTGHLYSKSPESWSQADQADIREQVLKVLRNL
jgi:hypothetical protein